MPFGEPPQELPQGPVEGGPEGPDEICRWVREMSREIFRGAILGHLGCHFVDFDNFLIIFVVPGKPWDSQNHRKTNEKPMVLQCCSR